MSADNHSRSPLDTPLWSWLNLLSLDAVAIGAFWQFLFTIEFCDRLPAAYELGIIGLSIWLVYAADRLLDSLRLDRSRRHTLRHRIHHDYWEPLMVAWLVVLSIDTWLVVGYASEAQLRWGFSAVALVIAYVVGVHRAGRLRFWIPKELQAGLVFAFGVSLPAWAERGLSGSFESCELTVATLQAGLLFAANCLLIACWERDLDLSQGFESWVTRFPAARHLPAAILAGHMLVTLAMLVGALLPLSIGICLIAGDGLLLTVILARRVQRNSASAHPNGIVPVSRFGLLADAAVVVPPMIGVCATVAIV